MQAMKVKLAENDSQTNLSENVVNLVSFNQRLDNKKEIVLKYTDLFEKNIGRIPNVKCELKLYTMEPHQNLYLQDR